MRKKLFFISVFILFLAFPLIFVPIVSAADTVSAGITPDNPLYFFDTLAEKISLTLAFNPVSNITKARKYATEKSAELALMLQKNKVGAQIKANQRYLEMVKAISKKMAEATKKDPEFKNKFVPQMLSVINGYDAVLKTQMPGKIKELGEITKEANDFFIESYEAPQRLFISLNLSTLEKKKKLCELAFTRPIKDEVTKIFEKLCGPEVVITTANEKKEAVYKTIFEVAAKDDISDATKALVQEIALADLPAAAFSSLETPAVEAAPTEFKAAKSRQIACHFSCNSYNCPAGQETQEKFEHKSRRIFDPWDWDGASLIDLLLLSVKVADTPSPKPALSFAVSEGSCDNSDKRSWHGSGTLNPDDITSKYAFNEEKFLNNFQAAFEEARRNCSARGDDSHTFTLMCSVSDFASGKRYSEQYGEISEKCSVSEAEAAQIEKTNVHNETWTYMASQHEAKNVPDIKNVKMVINPSGETLSVEFDAQTNKIQASGVLPAGNYDYEMKFILKDGQTVSPEGSGGHFTLQPCSQPVFDCAKVSNKIILDEYSGQGVCRGSDSDKLFLDQFGCVKKDVNEQFEDLPDYTEQLEDVNINVKHAGFCRYSLLDEAREQYDDAIQHRLYNEADGLWADDDELVTEKIDIGDEAIIFQLLDPMTNIESEFGYDQKMMIVARVGKCHIWAVGDIEPNNDEWKKYHYANLDKLYTEGIITNVNKHPNFDHGKQRLRDLLLEFAREVYGNIKDQCGN